MIRISVILANIAIAALLAGCAAPVTQRVSVSDQAVKDEADKQREIAVQDIVEEQKRLARIYQALRTKAEALCPEVGAHLGVYVMNRPENEFGRSYERVFGIQNRLTTLFVIDGSPAALAGLKARDIVLKVNRALTPDTKTASGIFEALAPGASVTIEIERNGTAQTIAVQSVRACKYPARVAPEQVINAFANGKEIFVTRGMMNFARDDIELATVIAHEMAHNTMAHMDAKKQNMGIGLLADIATILLSRGRVSNPNFAQAGAQAYSQEFEAEADYVGLYILAAAGYPIDDAPKFWRRMASANPGNIRGSHAASHPSTPYRMLALEETVKEIKDKIAKKLLLTPNLKDGKPQRTSDGVEKNKD